MDYKTIYKESITQKEEFWKKQAQRIVWDKEPTQILDDSNPPFYRWFKGGKLNACYNLVDRHVKDGYGEQIAMIYHSEMTGAREKISYLELQKRVSLCAGVMKSQGLVKGDRALVYMPMIPETLVAMLACTRLGVTHSVVFGGFAATELATRIKDADPRLIITASAGLEPNRVVVYQEIIEKALDICGKNSVEKILIVQREAEHWQAKPERDLFWNEAMKNSTPADCVSLDSEHPIYILYTSGTTGKPKGIVRDTAGHLVALKFSMDNLYNIKQGEVWWSASDVGWIVGHSYIVYAPLLHRCTTVIFEGKPVGTPDAAVFWKVINDYKVVSMFTAPTAIRAIKKEDPKGEIAQKYPMQDFRALFLAGERCDPDTLNWSKNILKVDIIDNWWQTETGWPICCNPMGIEQMSVKEGSSTFPVMGYEVQILDDKGSEVATGKMGNICIKLPLPPGTLLTLWNNDEGCKESYFKNFAGYYQTGDAGYFDEDGYLFIMSRTDDIINTAGHRLSTGAIEEVLAKHPDVAECAVTGVKHSLKGEIPFGFLVLKSGVVKATKEIISEATTMVRETIGPVAAFKELLIVPKLPKTRSGKILRKILRAIINKEEYRFPSTIEDVSVLDNIKELFKPKNNMDTQKVSPFMGWLIEKEVEEKCSFKEIAELPAEGVTIKIAYSTVNYKDALALSSKAPIARSFPMIPGIDLAGTVVSEGSSAFPKGTEVFSNGWGVGESHWGGLAQMACLPENYLQKIPKTITAKNCMALGTAGYTAMLCVLALLDNGVKPDGGKVAITGATGGVGSFALLFLAKMGYEIIAFTGKEDQIEALKKQGASSVLMRKDLEEKAKPLDKAVWNAAIDTVGGNVLSNILAKTKNEGVVSICGLTGGTGLHTTVMPFILRGVRLIGINSVTQAMKNRERAWQKIAELVSSADCENRSECVALKDAQEKAGELLQGKLSKRVIVDCQQ